MTRADAETLARLLRALCILKPRQTLHVGGQVVKPKPLKKPPKARGI